MTTLLVLTGAWALVALLFRSVVRALLAEPDNPRRSPSRHKVRGGGGR